MRTPPARLRRRQPRTCKRGPRWTLLIARYRQPRIQPALPSAVHRFDVVVAHFLQVLRHQCGAESAAAIEDELRIRVGNALFDVALNNAPAHVNGAGKMSLRPLVVLANID